MMKKRILAALLALLCLGGCSQAQEFTEYSLTEYPIVGDKFKPASQASQEGLLETSAAEPSAPPAAAPRTEEELYGLLLAGIQNRQEAIEDLGTDRELLSAVLHALWREHPELFWYESKGTISDEGEGTALRFEPDYRYTADEIAAYQTQLDAVCQPLTEELGGKSDYEKVKGVFDYVVGTASYSGNGDDMDIARTLVDHKAVCSGYAASLQYLLGLLGVECYEVDGELSGVTHAWNIVCMDGEWYHVDATVGALALDVEADTGPYYGCFAVTDEQIFRDHVSLMGEIPSCTATAWNYYQANGFYQEAYDFSSYVSMYTQAFSSGLKSCQVMFGSQEAYSAAVQELGKNSRLAEVHNTTSYTCALPPMSNLRFYADDERYVLMVFYMD